MHECWWIGLSAHNAIMSLSFNNNCRAIVDIRHREEQQKMHAEMCVWAIGKHAGLRSPCQLSARGRVCQGFESTSSHRTNYVTVKWRRFILFVLSLEWHLIHLLDAEQRNQRNDRTWPHYMCAFCVLFFLLLLLSSVHATICWWKGYVVCLASGDSIEVTRFMDEPDSPFQQIVMWNVVCEHGGRRWWWRWQRPWCLAALAVFSF